ncbi:hypothetical protein [Methylobacterium currus]|uniref:hypothetical protein n=1 Tax=Methylobacterium currus TaxID=2051553 RepID=UPI000F508FF6|nr:hypothetical protein [Methylobacterium currus]
MPIAFIVDGISEKRIVQKLCSGAQVRTTGLNGRDVTLAAIATKVESLIRLLKDRYYPIFVVLDRESREDGSEYIELEIKKILEEKGICINNIVVSCPDRMIENWIVAGTTHYAGEVCDIALDRESPDGFGGKGVLKEFLQKRKVIYGETTVGVEMFCAMDFEAAAKRSESCRRFLVAISPYCPKFAGKSFRWI